MQEMLPFVKVITRVKVSNNVQYDKKTKVFQYHIVLRIVNEWHKLLQILIDAESADMAECLRRVTNILK